MEKRLGVTLRQSYVTRITTMLNSGMIPTGKSDIIHRFLLGKTRPGDEIRNWKNQNWDGYCKQCCKVIETTAHIFECEKTRAYLDALSINTAHWASMRQKVQTSFQYLKLPALSLKCRQGPPSMTTSFRFLNLSRMLPLWLSYCLTFQMYIFVKENFSPSQLASSILRSISD